jgi:CBS domain-containing protein
MVTDDLTLDQLVNNFFMKYRFGRFPVVDNMDTEKFVGVVSIHDVKTIKQEEWNATTVREIVEKVSDKEIISVDSEVSDAIKQMNKNNLSHLVILSGKKLIGMITKSDVMQFIQLLSELR